MTYKPYPKEYKTRMLAYAKERLEACERNIKTFTLYANTSLDKEVKNKALCQAIKEMDLKRFLNGKISIWK